MGPQASRVKAPLAAGERSALQSRAVAAPGSGTTSSKALCHHGAFCLACAKLLSPLFFPSFLIKEDYRFPSLSPGFILKRLNDMLTP